MGCTNSNDNDNENNSRESDGIEMIDHNFYLKLFERELEYLED